MVILVYLVLGEDEDGLQRLHGVFFDPTEADRACSRCPRRFGGDLRAYRVEEVEAGILWRKPL